MTKRRAPARELLRWDLKTNRLFTADPAFAGQPWKRASYLCPLLCPVVAWRGRLHDLGRGLRHWWPVWAVYSIGGKRLGMVWACGAQLIQKEVELTSKDGA